MKKLTLLVIAGAVLFGGGLASQGADDASAGSTWSFTSGGPTVVKSEIPPKFDPETGKR